MFQTHVHGCPHSITRCSEKGALRFRGIHTEGSTCCTAEDSAPSSVNSYSSEGDAPPSSGSITCSLPYGRKHGGYDGPVEAIVLDYVSATRFGETKAIAYNVEDYSGYATVKSAFYNRAVPVSEKSMSSLTGRGFLTDEVIDGMKPMLMDSSGVSPSDV